MVGYYLTVRRVLVLLTLALVLSGCATNKINWTGRVGSYTFDQAVIDYGPPDKLATLNDGSIVAVWRTHRGHTYVHVTTGYGYYPWAYGPYYSPFVDTYTSPDYFLRLVFGKDGVLKDYRKLVR